jgi:hypothetical protein
MVQTPEGNIEAGLLEANQVEGNRDREAAAIRSVGAPDDDGLGTGKMGRRPRCYVRHAR